MKAFLALEDGFMLEGRSVTGACDAGGEVIFNTGMTGYQEILTDPSYAGQMVCMTWPEIGNYGIAPEDMESDRVHASALLMRECCQTPSNWRSAKNLPNFLADYGIPGIEGLDTRALTLHLREYGAMRGVISTNSSDPRELAERAKALPEMAGQNLVAKVAPSSPWRMGKAGPRPAAPDATGAFDWTCDKPGAPRVLVYDFGIKWNIVRMLTAHGFSLVMVPPSFTPAETEASGADAIFLSNGPGDPAVLSAEIATVRELAKKWPIAGICLGHQLLGHALGGSTYKLKFGHHGCNHPVKDLETGIVEITSQNHGFCVDIGDVPGVRTTHVNLNDGTLEGFAHTSLPIIAVQHHPEACPGPSDSRTFFARFRRLVREATGR